MNFPRLLECVAVVAALLLLHLGCCQHLEEGDPCKLRDGTDGVCQKLINCESAKREIKNETLPKVCSFQELNPIVCCVVVREVDKEEFKKEVKDGKAKMMCREYAKFVYQNVSAIALVPEQDQYAAVSRCESSIPLIVGGSEARPREFPHMALIGYNNASDIKWLCAGSLISPRFVLTAGKCVQNPLGGQPRWVRVGEFDIEVTTDNARPQDLAVVEAISHPDFRPPNLYNDIGLLKLEKDVDINEYVRPCCLHKETAIGVRNVVASGWGPMDWINQERSDVLKKVILKVQLTNDCEKAFRFPIGNQKYPEGIIEEKMLCAGDKKKGQDMCLSNYGSPLQYMLNDPECMYAIVGVTSFDRTICGDITYTIYTRVSHFVPWIESVVWPED